MATKSLMKNIDIRDKRLGKSLVVALENASKKRAKEVTISRTCSDASPEIIKRIFDQPQ